MAKQAFEKTYERKELTDSPAGVVTASMAIRHWNKENPGWKVVQLSQFKMNHEDRTVTLKVVAQSVESPVVTSHCVNCVELQAKLDAENKLCRCDGCADYIKKIDELKEKLSEATVLINDLNDKIRSQDAMLAGVGKSDEAAIEKDAKEMSELVAAVHEGPAEEETPNEVLDEQRPVEEEPVDFKAATEQLHEANRVYQDDKPEEEPEFVDHTHDTECPNNGGQG